MTTTSPTHANAAAVDADRQEKLQKEKDKAVADYEKNPEKAEEAGRKDYFDRMKESLGTLKEDINNAIPLDPNGPVEPRSGGMTHMSTKAQKVDDDGQVIEGKISDRSTNPKDKNASVTVDPADGSKRTKDGVK